MKVGYVIRPEVADKLADLAEILDTSMSDVVERAVEQMWKKVEKVEQGIPK